MGIQDREPLARLTEEGLHWGLDGILAVQAQANRELFEGALEWLSSLIAPADHRYTNRFCSLALVRP